MYDLTKLQKQVIQLAKQAGSAITDIYQQNTTVEVQRKADASPLTQADLIAHQIISQGLQQITPEWPVLSEESATIDWKTRQQWNDYWLVDPLDGTKEFIAKTGDFTVNIALVKQHKPIMGVIYAPIWRICYFAIAGQGVFKQIGDHEPQVIHCQSFDPNIIRVITSRRHGLQELRPFLNQLDHFAMEQRGSALKSCLVAEGAADIYPRLGPTSEWDTAAAQCIIETAGGALIDLNGQALRYNARESLENPQFLAIGDNSFNWLQYFNN